MILGVPVVPDVARITPPPFGEFTEVRYCWIILMPGRQGVQIG